jgi:hypothetical protein
VAAGKQQAQHVVAIVSVVQRFGGGAFRILEIGNRILVGQRGLLGPPPNLIESRIATNKDKPRGGIARRAVLRPVLERPQAGFLKRLFRQIEIAEIAQQRANRLRPRRVQRCVDPVDVRRLGAAPPTSRPGR